MKAILKKIFDYLYKNEIEELKEQVSFLEDLLEETTDTVDAIITRQDETIVELNKIIDFINTNALSSEHHEEDINKNKPKSHLLN